MGPWYFPVSAAFVSLVVLRLTPPWRLGRVGTAVMAGVVLAVFLAASLHAAD
jgi:hypothetical protein